MQLNSPTSSVDKTNLIHKLGIKESMFVRGNITTISAYTLKTKVDIFANANLFEKALAEWQRRDPFLQCKLHKTDSNEFFYERLPNPQTLLKQNVKFLKLATQKPSLSSPLSEFQIWTSLLQIEPDIEMNFFDDLLWRMKIVELSGQNSYALIFCVHHCIGEGRGFMKKLLELFEIFERHFMNNNDNSGGFSDVKNGDVNEFRMTPNFDELIKERRYQVSFLSSLTEFRMDEVLSKLSERELGCDGKQQEFKENNSDADYSLFDLNGCILEQSSGEIYLTFNELFDKARNAESKMRPVLIENEKYRTLVAKCKANNAKVNSCLNLIFALATHQTLDKFFPNPQSRYFYEKTMTYISLISNRNLFDLDKTFSNFGNFISQFGYILNDENLGDEMEVFPKFWKLCKKETDTMQRLIESEEIVEIDLNRAEAEHKLLAHFATSNIGIMPSSLTKDKFVEFTQRYIHSHMLSCIFFMVGACTINEKLSLSFLYSTKVTSSRMIDCLIESVHEIINKVIKMNG